jgi:hypothetical protein
MLDLDDTTAKIDWGKETKASTNPADAYWKATRLDVDDTAKKSRLTCTFSQNRNRRRKRIVVSKSSPKRRSG